MTADDSRARQLEIVMSAVEEGMLDSMTALRAVTQWLSSSDEQLCDILLVQPDLTDASRQSIRARFAEVAFADKNTKPVEADDRTINASGIRRLRVFLEEPEELAHAAATVDTTIEHGSDRAQQAAAQRLDDGTVDFSIDAAKAGAVGEATATFVPGSKPTDSRVRVNFVLEHFQVLREFAQGGLGILYLAQDKRLQRNVILKKIRPEYAKSSLARDKFVLEAEVTGQLEHPGIVPIYALGTDGQREPYYAMRLIDGKNLHAAIADFHAQRTNAERFFDGLRFRELLQRFVDVCHALHYSHSRGIIHRDLKPANIMLGEHGETLVIDWGLAKALSTTASSEAIKPADQSQSWQPIEFSGEKNPTIEGEFGGTARYAPPEQLAGQIQRLCPASDIYSLGAILVEILCNKPALDGKIENARQALARIEAGQLRSPRSIVPDVPRPLNAICVKAMAINIPDRYATAQELAEDVQRWLADECVLAYRHQETRLEQVGRWLRHHRSWAAGIALSLVALTVSALVANYFINQARLNEKTAKRQAIEFKEDAVTRYRVAKSAVDTLMDRSDKLLDIAGTDAIREQLLQEAATKYAQLSQTQSLDPELEIERARAMVRLADALALQNQKQAAFEHYDQVIGMLTQKQDAGLDVNQLSTTELMRRIELGRSLTRRALAFSQYGDIAPARSDFHRAIDLLKNLQTNQANTADSSQLAGNLAIVQLSLGALEEEQGRDAIALSFAQDSLQEYESQDLTNERLFAVNLVRTHQLLERLYRKLGRRDEAVKQLGLADETLTRMLAQDPRNPQTIELRAALWVSAASQARHQGDYRSAISALGKSLEVYDQLNKTWPASTNYLLGMALCQLDMTLVYEDLEEYDQGSHHLEFAFQLFNSLQDSMPQNQLALYRADTLDTAGSYLMAFDQTMPVSAHMSEVPNQFGDALALLQPLVERLKDAPDKVEPLAIRMARIQSHQARAYVLIKDTVAAKSCFDQAVGLLEPISGPNSPTSTKRQLAHTLWHRALLEHENQEVELATTHFERARDLWLQVYQADHSPLHQYELAHFYLRCPVAPLQNLQQAIQYAQASSQGIPDNPIFARLLSQAIQTGTAPAIK